MFFVSALGLMIRMSPPDARGRVAGMFSGAFLVGSVAGPVVGSLTAGLGLSAPFIIYGVLLLFAAVVVLLSLRNSPLAGPSDSDEPTVTLRVAMRHRAYRSALLSNFATGWSLFGLRFALVPLFVDEALNQTPAVAGLALAAFAIGNVSVVMYSGRLSDRIGRRPLLIGGLMLSAVTTAVLGLTESAPMFFVAAVIAGAASGVYNSPQQAAVADIIGKARGGTAIATFQMMSDFGSIVGSFGVGVLAQQLSYGWAFGISGAILLLAAIGWMFAPETRDQSPLEHTPARPLGPEAAGELP
jgi:MFS family permease